MIIKYIYTIKTIRIKEKKENVISAIFLQKYLMGI